MRGRRRPPEVLAAARAAETHRWPTHDDDDTPVPLSAIERMTLREAESAAAEQQAYEEGRLDPLQCWFHEHPGVKIGWELLLDDPDLYGEFVSALFETGEVLGRAEAAHREAVEDAVLAQLVESRRPISNATQASQALRDAIVAECKRRHDQGDIVKGSDVARYIGCSNAIVSKVRNQVVSEYLEAGSLPPPWAVSSTRRARIGKLRKGE